MDKGDDYADELKSKFKRTKKDAGNLVEKGKAQYDDAKKHTKNAAADF